MAAYYTNHFFKASTSLLLVPLVRRFKILAIGAYTLCNLGLRGWFEGYTSMATQYQEGLFRNEPCHTKHWEKIMSQYADSSKYSHLSGELMPVKPNGDSIEDVIHRFWEHRIIHVSNIKSELLNFNFSIWCVSIKCLLLIHWLRNYLKFLSHTVDIGYVFQLLVHVQKCPSVVIFDDVSY